MYALRVCGGRGWRKFALRFIEEFQFIRYEVFVVFEGELLIYGLKSQGLFGGRA